MENIEKTRENIESKPAESCCCGGTSSSEVCEETKVDLNVIPQVTSEIKFSDKLGVWKSRWGINRMDYRVNPGLYRLGNPDEASPVFVTANYRLTFDRLRKNLKGFDGWILVLDSKGINVWCAAGKGTFGTEELINRINVTGLSSIISHHILILPQLGATGVSAHQVKAETGFKVKFGPVRSEDLPAYIEAKLRADDRMRKVEFPFYDRLVLVPVELVMSAKYLLLTAAVLILLSGINPSGYSTEIVFGNAPKILILLLTCYFAGAAIAPMFLPYLPGRSFSVKGIVSGFLTLGIAVLIPGWYRYLFNGELNFIGWALLSAAISSFLAMNFTGASTYTSLSGVRKEMRRFVPLQLTAAIIGFALVITSQFVG